MQPKADTTIAAGVIEIVKTFISHPDHGVKFDEIGKLVKDVSQAFHEAALLPGIATTAAAPLAVAAESKAEVAIAEAAPANEDQASTKAPSKAKASNKATAKTADVAESKPKLGRPKKVAAPVAEAAPVEEVIASAPVVTDPLEEKFGGRIPRTTFNNMDPEEAIQNDKIVCLIDGQPRKMLHRHLLAKFNMTPEEYRAWFNLRADYPMTAPGYSKEKSDYAKVVGLGTVGFVERTKGATAEVEAPAPEPAPAAATPKTSRRERTKKPSSTKRQKTNA